MNKKLLILVAIIVYFLATGISYAVFSRLQATGPGGLLSPTGSTTAPKVGQGNDYKAITFDPNQPKTQECPLNGALYSKEEEAWWKQHRPLGVMIENTPDARPQSGLSFADVVYEAVAEGGITRFLGIFYCQDAGIIGPVRSARTYFVDFISEYGNSPLYAHVGGANADGPANALGQLDQYGWTGYNDLNQFSIGFPTYTRIDTRNGRSVATEHTMYSVTSSLWSVGASRQLTNVDKNGKSWDSTFIPYTFKEDAPLSERPASEGIHVDFWADQTYSADWKYDKQTNRYLRSTGGEEHDDRNTHKQLSTKNLVILYMKESHADDGYENDVHLLYGDKGTGNALVFQDGKEIKATWSKASRTGRTKLTASDGSQIPFDRGTIWFEIVPTYSTVAVK